MGSATSLDASGSGRSCRNIPGYGYPDFVLAFSNPQLSHPNDPDLKLGVPGDGPSSAQDGPADAVRHLNEVRGIVANVRARADADPCRYEVSGDQDTRPPEGGTYSLRVETEAGCHWEASGGEWVSSASPDAGTGSGEVEIAVGRNDNWSRPLEVLVAGRLHRRWQAGSRPIKPLCERTIWPDIVEQLQSLHPEHDYFHWSCQDYSRRLFNAENLAAIRTFAPPARAGSNILYGGFDWSDRWGFGAEDRGMRLGDFDGLTGLTELRINNVDRLPPNLFSGLTGLRSLEIGRDFWDSKVTLSSIAPGAFHGLPGLLRLIIDGHGLGVLPAAVFDGMPSLLGLEIRGRHRDELEWPVTTIEPGALAGLSNLRLLKIFDGRMEGLEAGVVSELGKLGSLSLRDNLLEAIAPGSFDGLDELRLLDLSHNALTSLPAGLFAGLAKLEDLTLDVNRLDRLSSGAFEGLRSLGLLDLSHNRLATLEPGTFSGLPKVAWLSLRANRLRNLQPGGFEGLGQLSTLDLRGNRLGALRAGLFKGLRALDYLHLDGSGATLLSPGVFDDTPHLRVLLLRRNRLRSIAPGTFGELHLRGLHLGGNPGEPFAFEPSPVVHPAWEVAAGPVEVAVEVLPDAPFAIDAAVEASGGTLSDGEVHVSPGQGLGSAPVLVTPSGDGPVTVRVDQVRWPHDLRPYIPSPSSSGGVTFGVYEEIGYSGIRVEPGPPLVLQGIADRALVLGRGPETIDLAGAFPLSLELADYSAESNDGAVAAVSVEDGALAVSPRGAGSATVTVTATAPDGGTLTREFRVTVRAPSVPLLLSDSNPQREGFVRLINRSDRDGAVRVTAFDDGGARFGPVNVPLKANGAVHFNSGDLEGGNAAKGLPEGIGAGQGAWRLEFESALDIEALAYARARDGFVTGLHGAAPAEEGVHRVATFNPASNDRQVSRLRVVNPGLKAAEVTVRGVDDAGASPGGPVRFTVPAGAAREYDARELEEGGGGLEGALGDGEGKWRLEVESGGRVVVMSLLESVATGHLTNLSSLPPPAGADGVHRLALFPAASRDWQGFARVVNRSDRAGTVRIEAYDDAGERRGPLELSLGAGRTAHFNSDDLELGNADKGLSGSTGPGEGDWWLEMTSALDIEVLGYVRTRDGFLAAMHDVAQVEDGRRRAVFFNPASNTRQVSRLRLVNPTPRDVEVSVVGTDDSGGAQPNRGATWVTVPSRQALTLEAPELEAGAVAQFFVDNGFVGGRYEVSGGYWDRWPLGDGTGKWRLSVAAEPGVLVQSLLESPTGHLTNLSLDGR